MVEARRDVPDQLLDLGFEDLPPGRMSREESDQGDGRDFESPVQDVPPVGKVDDEVMERGR